MRRPVVISISVDPVRPEETPEPCEVCNGEARWISGRPEQVRFFCAYCFLYETEGGRQNAGRIFELVEAVEKKMGVPISKNGKATRRHSDRILGSIVMISRMRRANRIISKIKRKEAGGDEGNRSRSKP